MTEIVVAIVNHNTREQLRACLATVMAEAPNEVLVIDNASSDGSIEMLQAEYPSVRLWANKANVGYGSAANQAAAASTATYILFLNSDTLLQTGALRSLSSYLDQNPLVGILGPRLINPDGTLQVSCYPFPTPLNVLFVNTSLGALVKYIPLLRHRYLPTSPHRSARAVPWVKGAALAIRREAFEVIGGFDDSFFLYFEETDLCFRLRAAGWQVHFAPVTEVMHAGGVSTRQYGSAMAAQYLSSAIRFCRRHYSAPRVAAIIVALKAIEFIRLVQDVFRFFTTSDAQKRADVAMNIVMHKTFLFGQRRHYSRCLS